MTKLERVLVVDDAPDNLFLIQSILEEENLDIILVDNGHAALQVVENDPPDLILLDVMMPEMDGFEVTRRIRENPNVPFIPILLITAYAQPSVALGLDTGADDFIRKPVEIEELTARVRSLLRLKRTADERNAIARQREDFASRLTHDMRTPLIAAARMMDLMLQGALGELSETMQEALRTMDRSNKNLLEMVNNILEVYRYESERKRFNFSRVDLRSLINNVVQELLPLAEEKNLPLQVHFPGIEGELICRGDRLALHRVFTNLINNAIKFTTTGTITIHVTQPNPEEWAIAVSDTGMGITPEEQLDLFQRFRQGNHYHGGSGLGLHLSLLIAEAHHGTIQVQSEHQKGSTFTVILPRQQPAIA